MKNFSPRFGASFFAGSILFLAFSTSSFAVRGGRFPGDFEGPREETQRQELDREMTVNSSSAARSSAFSTASEPQAADPKHGAFVKELLAKTDGEIENHLINSEVRKKFLER
ncbi:MAG: hypothetical protein FJ390_06685, partial [Verrucomicrobia bacterium]|nr:hypothetical protein [Verrucomicrobiota bacterium]